MAQTEMEIVLPSPKVHKIAGEEIRQEPLPLRKLLLAMRFVEGNVKLLEKFQTIGKPKAEGEGSVAFSDVLETEVFVALNKLLRLLIPSSAALMTDEWCADHLSPAHYRVFLQTALVQNEMYDLFTMAKGVFGQFITQKLRQAEKAANPSA